MAVPRCRSVVAGWSEVNGVQHTILRAFRLVPAGRKGSVLCLLRGADLGVGRVDVAGAFPNGNAGEGVPRKSVEELARCIRVRGFRQFRPFVPEPRFPPRGRQILLQRAR